LTDPLCECVSYGVDDAFGLHRGHTGEDRQTDVTSTNGLGYRECAPRVRREDRLAMQRGFIDFTGEANAELAPQPGFQSRAFNARADRCNVLVVVAPAARWEGEGTQRLDPAQAVVV